MKKGQKGFTLVELMIVLVVMGIMAIVAAPNLISGLPKYRIKSAVRDCTSALRSARSRAIKDKRDVEISFNAEKQFFVIDGRKLPVSGSLERQYGSGVRFGNGAATTGVDGESIPSDAIDFNDNRFTFTSRGMADFGAGDVNGALYFTNNRDDTYAVTVNAAGAVAVQRWRGKSWER